VFGRNVVEEAGGTGANICILGTKTREKKYGYLFEDIAGRSVSGQEGLPKYENHLMKVRTEMTNRDSGNLPGAMSYSAVAEAHAQFGARLSEEKTLRRKIGDVEQFYPLFKG
jgi:hypothetical protein